MKELFKIKDLHFFEEDHDKCYDEEYAERIEEIESNIPIIQDLQDYLSYEKITCTEVNRCCKKSKDNYFVEIQGFIDDKDEFYTKEEASEYEMDKSKLNIYVIRIYKCVDCGKWIIDIIDDGIGSVN